MKKNWLLIAVGLIVAVLAIAAIACGDDDDGDGNGNGDGNGIETPSDGNGTGNTHEQTLSDVLARGRLNCGVNDGVPGFGFLEADGTSSGFDVDFCRALAAAIFGDSELVDYVILTAAARFEALAGGEIDVLIRNTTWTLSRDAELNASFATTTFYDGQGMMVRVADGFDSIDDMEGTTICSLQGTTTELNLADRFEAGGLSYEGLTFEDNGPLEAAFTAEACQGWTSDQSQLAARRSAYPEADGGPESLLIFPEVFSKEPLGPVTRDDDSQWFDIVNWVVIGMITADEKGITSANLADFVADPGEVETSRLLGLPIEGTVFDSTLGIDPDFMQDVIAQVGNYGELYEKHIEPLGIPREGSLNASWLDGGLIYAPPWR